MSELTVQFRLCCHANAQWLFSHTEVWQLAVRAFARLAHCGLKH
jgi:hypothetical protein